MTKYFIADEKSDGKRLDIAVCEFNPDLSRNFVQTLIKEGFITLNEKNVKPSAKLSEGDKITINCENSGIPEIKPENINIEIVYEDDNCLVVNKPSDMLTHPTNKEFSGTLVNALLFKYGREGLSDINGELRPGILHRLDRNTSGLLMIAKNNRAHEFLSSQIKDKTAIRKYIAVLTGVPDKDEGIIDAPISRHKTKPEKFIVSKDGKPSITYYRVLEKFKIASFVEFTLATGRTHQIRVHSAYINHPVVNDTLYGGLKLKVHTTEQVLQAYKLEFTPPGADGKVKLEISPDNDIIKTLNYLRNLKQ